jgi:hypothetical protein
LPPCAGGGRIARHHSKNPAIFGLRFVPALAAICRSLVQRKGNKRATSEKESSTQIAGNRFLAMARAVRRSSHRTLRGFNNLRKYTKVQSDSQSESTFQARALLYRASKRLHAFSG